MKTGDLLLTKGNGALSTLIMLHPKAEYSHVMMYYDHPIYGPCIAESTSMGTVPDIITGEIANGVQLTPYQERIDSYDGEVYHRPLNKPLSPTRLARFDTLFMEFHKTPYEEDNLQLFRAQADIFPWDRNSPDLSTIFCSEICAVMARGVFIMKVMGKPDNEFTPTDYARKLRMICGYLYLDVARLK